MEIRARTKVGYNCLVQSYSSRPSLVQSTISVRTRKSTRKRTFNNRLGWVLTLWGPARSSLQRAAGRAVRATYL
eukprot:4296851-Prymnesium_polylepis.1